tara:strand:- start:391 stop:537 length:147 start_codon:yes stop_codon:yes gene_type:complete
MDKDMTEQDNFRVPTYEEIIEALRLPEVQQKLDSLGRVARKRTLPKAC